MVCLRIPCCVGLPKTDGSWWRSDRRWSTGEGNDKPLQYFLLENPMNSRKQETRGVTGKFGLGLQNEAGQRLIEFCQEHALVIENTLL